MTTNSKIDPITTQVIRSSLVAAAEEMRIALVQTAYKPLDLRNSGLCGGSP